MTARERRDERRRLQLIQQRKKPGRPPGLTPVRFHPKRFEAAIWLTFRQMHFSYVDAGRLTFLLLRHKGPFELLDLGYGYALWRGQDPFSQHDNDDPLSRQYRDLKTTALELVKRSEGNEDDQFWLKSSIITFAALWSAAGRNDHTPVAVGMNLLIKLGWPQDFLRGISERLATLPTRAAPGAPPFVEGFARSARRHRLSVARNLISVSKP